MDEKEVVSALSRKKHHSSFPLFDSAHSDNIPEGRVHYNRHRVKFGLDYFFGLFFWTIFGPF